MFERSIQEFLSNRAIAVGDSVQIGWLVLWVEDLGPPPRLRSLDFSQMASFTNDLSIPEAIYQAQQQALKENWIEKEEACTMLNTALVSKSYTPGHEDAFLEREEPCEGNDSGWYVGLVKDPASEDPDACELRSLYELSIRDRRMIPFWTFPVGTQVILEEGIARDAQQ